MNLDDKINGSLKRIEIYYKQAIRNIFTDNIELEIQHINTLHKQINRECDIIIQIGNHLIALVDAGYIKEIAITTRDNRDME